MKRYICTAVVAVTLTIVAGCGGGGEPAGSNSTPAATTTTTEAAAGEATVEQYAGLVASHVGLWGAPLAPHRALEPFQVVADAGDVP
jgi:hypothetical protein